uniref:GPI ethanolamine phosphate transferase 2 n=1 Tax=Heterorhabditis bacteriophora TaxID=37862 RepID=A0A1I7WJZ5_HETBA
MDAIISETSDALSEGDLLVVLGDHGMTSSGDHGGDSSDEINAGILYISLIFFSFFVYRIMNRLQTTFRSTWTQFDTLLMRVGLVSFAESLLFVCSSRSLDAPLSIIRSGCLLLQLSIVLGGADQNPAVPLLMVCYIFVYTTRSSVRKLIIVSYFNYFQY